MIVVDASAVVDLVLDTESGQNVLDVVQKYSLRAPDILDFEVFSAIRRSHLSGIAAVEVAELALSDFMQINLTRSPTTPLLWRAFELRHSIPGGDALYVALAERLHCPLVTTDGRLARSHGHDADIRLITASPLP